MLKECLMCGKSFSTNTLSRKYCSKECRKKHESDMLKLRRETDPAFREHLRERSRNNNKERYQKDPEFRERCKKRSKKTYKKAKERYATEPEYRRKRYEYNKKYLDKIKGEPTEKYCLICGKLLPPSRRKHYYCSEECRKKAYTAPEKQCPICKSMFQPVGRQVYCSPMCYKTARTTPRVIKKCKTCGKYYAGKKSSLYCSASCKEQAKKY